MLESVRQDAYPKARNYLVTTALNLGGKGADKDSKKILHEQGNYEATKKLGETRVIPPWLAANISDLAYLGNETLTGSLAAATGRPFFSDYGFRWGDVAINRRGQDQDVAELEAEARRRDEARRQLEASVPFFPLGGKE